MYNICFRFSIQDCRVNNTILHLYMVDTVCAWSPNPMPVSCLPYLVRSQGSVAFDKKSLHCESSHFWYGRATRE